MPLTDTKIRTFKISDKPVKLAGGGLYLYCSNTGRKYWRLYSNTRNGLRAAFLTLPALFCLIGKVLPAVNINRGTESTWFWIQQNYRLKRLWMPSLCAFVKRQIFPVSACVVPCIDRNIFGLYPLYTLLQKERYV